MIAREVNIVLTRAALLDPRMKRVDPEEQADMALAWADALADVPLDVALAAVSAHYRASREPLMLADLVAAAGVDATPDEWEHLDRVDDDQVLALSRTRELAAAGVTEAEYAAHADDVAWLREKFPHHFPTAAALDAGTDRDGWLA